jgi:hypothetical protein
MNRGQCRSESITGTLLFVFMIPAAISTNALETAMKKSQTSVPADVSILLNA